MIKNLIFDMGNVLLKYNPHLTISTYLTSDEYSKYKEVVYSALFGSKEWQLGDMGTVTDSEILAAARLRLPQTLHSAVSDMMAHWHEFLVPFDGCTEFIAEMKSVGFRLYILSNTSMRFFDYRKTFQLFDYFDGFVISAQEKMVKPDPRIYKLLLERYTLNPEECFFIDDMPENISAANSCGIDGFVFNGCYADVRAAISR